jgi:hypothetical protein
MPMTMPNMPESLSYSVVAAIGLAVLAGLVLLLTGDPVAGVLVLAVALAIYRLIGRALVTLVGAREVAAAAGLLFLLCALIDLVTGYPYDAVIFLLAAAALGFAFLALQQGTLPAELRLGGVQAVAGPSARIHLRMLEELRDAGILTPDEFAAKHLVVGL